MPRSWKPEVIADSSGKWAGNALRFATREEAERSVADLARRWTLVTDTRVVESDDEPNYRHPEGMARAEPIREGRGEGGLRGARLAPYRRRG